MKSLFDKPILPVKPNFTAEQWHERIRMQKRLFQRDFARSPTDIWLTPEVWHIIAEKYKYDVGGLGFFLGMVLHIEWGPIRMTYDLGEGRTILWDYEYGMGILLRENRI